jgi:hypothetical protein
MVIHDFGSPNSHPIISRAGNKASIANATTDIKDISATNSNWKSRYFFALGKKYGIGLVSSLFSGIPKALN